MPDLRISELPPITAASLASSDPLPLADLSASETKKVTVKDLIQGGVPLIDDGSIPGTKVAFNIPAGSIGTAELEDKSVTAYKLADNSSVLVQATLPTTGTYVGQLVLDTDEDKLYCWNGNSWAPVQAAGSVNSIVAGPNDVLELTIVITGDVATIVPGFRDTSLAAQFAAGPSASGGAVTMRSIASLDLPRATNTLIGGISTPIGGGLRIEDPSEVGANAQAVIDNDIAPSTTTAHLVTYSEKGLVLSGRLVESSDLPIATANSNGVIQGGTEFTVTPVGVLQSANQIAAGVGTKVQYNGQGQITAATPLLATDIPDLDASQITTGNLAPGLFADKSISMQMLADYSTMYIQEGEPSNIDPGFIGLTWYQPTTAQLRVWDGNYFAPIGFGRLSADNLRWGGLVNATTGLVTGVTSAGQAGGLVIGQPLPVATDGLGGLYVVIDIAGDAITVTPGITYDPGDWCLCINEAEGWVRIDTLSSGGGGGGASVLNDLLDVTITNPTVGDLLIFDANTGLWTNTETIDGGTY